MSYNNDVREPFATVDYNKFVRIEGDNRFPALTAVRIQGTEFGNMTPLTSYEVYPKYAVLSYIVNASDISGGGGGGGSVSFVDKEFNITKYSVVNSFSGASVGDVVSKLKLYDTSVNPPTASYTVWFNETTDTPLTVTPNSSDVSVVGDRIKLVNTPIVEPKNLFDAIRENGTTYTPNQTWLETLGTNDVVIRDGNTAGSDYIVVSKSQIYPGTTTIIESLCTFTPPFEGVVGLSMSQRTLGQEFSIEYVSNDTPLTINSDVPILSVIQNNSTTLFVSTISAHNLIPGLRFGISGVVDPRFNYQLATVATVPNLSTFTATVATLNASSSGGFVYFRPALGGAQDGSSMILENSTATNASFYVRTGTGVDALPSGTINGSHASTIATTAPVQAIVAPFSYSFQPTNEYRLVQYTDHIQWSDAPVDTTTSTFTSRYKRTQVVPDPNKAYKLRIRATNNKSITSPIAQILSATKVGTLATVTTDIPHTLSGATELVNIYGAFNQTGFPNITTATAVTALSPNTLQLTWGTALTATSFGGYIARVNAGTVMSSMGAISQVAQTLSLTSNVLSITGNGTWTGFTFGDSIDLYGFYDTNGDPLTSINAKPWKVANFSTTLLTLIPLNNATYTDIPFLSCSGGILKRTDLRLSYARVVNFNRQRVEMSLRPGSDVSQSVPVNVQNTPAVTVSSGTITTVTGVNSVAGVSAVTSVSSVAGVTNISQLDTQPIKRTLLDANELQQWSLGVRNRII